MNPLVVVAAVASLLATLLDSARVSAFACGDCDAATHAREQHLTTDSPLG